MKKTIKKSQPKPPVKKYTAQDSAQYEAVGKRFDANVAKLNRAPVRKSGGMEFSSGLDVDIMPTMRKQMDSMVRNPYFPTAKARAAAKSKTGGMKGTKPNPQSEKKKIDSAKQAAKSKSTIKSKMTESGVPKMKMKTPLKNYKK